MWFRALSVLLLPCLALAATGAGAGLCDNGVCDAGEDENAALLQSAAQAQAQASGGPAARAPSPRGAASSAAQEKTHVKIRRATVRRVINMSDVWDQLTGSVQIDELQAQLKKAAADSQAKIQAELDKLEKAYPAYAEIKEKFAAQWDKIVSAVNLDELKKQVAACTADLTKCANDKYSELQSQLESAMKGVDLDGIKAQTEEYWNKIQLELPDMGELKKQADLYGDQAKSAWDEFMQTNDFSSLTDAAQSIVNDAWGQVSGWFR
jgi:hypothetical protein